MSAFSFLLAKPAACFSNKPLLSHPGAAWPEALQGPTIKAQGVFLILPLGQDVSVIIDMQNSHIIRDLIVYHHEKVPFEGVGNIAESRGMSLCAYKPWDLRFSFKMIFPNSANCSLNAPGLPFHLWKGHPTHKNSPCPVGVLWRAKGTKSLEEGSKHLSNTNMLSLFPL